MLLSTDQLRDNQLSSIYSGYEEDSIVSKYLDCKEKYEFQSLKRSFSDWKLTYNRIIIINRARIKLLKSYFNRLLKLSVKYSKSLHIAILSRALLKFKKFTQNSKFSKKLIYLSLNNVYKERRNFKMKRYYFYCWIRGFKSNKIRKEFDEERSIRKNKIANLIEKMNINKFSTTKKDLFIDKLDVNHNDKSYIPDKKAYTKKNAAKSIRRDQKECSSKANDNRETHGAIDPRNMIVEDDIIIIPSPVRKKMYSSSVDDSNYEVDTKTNNDLVFRDDIYLDYPPPSYESINKLSSEKKEFSEKYMEDKLISERRSSTNYNSKLPSSALPPPKSRLDKIKEFRRNAEEKLSRRKKEEELKLK